MYSFSGFSSTLPLLAVIIVYVYSVVFENKTGSFRKFLCVHCWKGSTIVIFARHSFDNVSGPCFVYLTTSLTKVPVVMDCYFDYA